MARPGNPNHDPRTGKFTSGSGLNASNSTRGERAKAGLKTAAKAAAVVGVGLALHAAQRIGAAAVTGARRTMLREADRAMTDIVTGVAPHVHRAASQGSAAVLSGISAAGKSAAGYAASLKEHIKSQHQVRGAVKSTTFGHGKIKSTITGKKFPGGHSPMS